MNIIIFVVYWLIMKLLVEFDSRYEVWPCRIFLYFAYGSQLEASRSLMELNTSGNCHIQEAADPQVSEVGGFSCTAYILIHFG